MAPDGEDNEGDTEKENIIIIPVSFNANVNLLPPCCGNLTVFCLFSEENYFLTGLENPPPPLSGIVQNVTEGNQMNPSISWL